MRNRFQGRNVFPQIQTVTDIHNVATATATAIDKTGMAFKCPSFIRANTQIKHLLTTPQSIVIQLQPVKQWDTQEVTLTSNVHRVARSCDPLSISKLTNGFGSTRDVAIQGRLDTFSRQEVLRDFSKCMLGVLSEIRKLGVTTSASLQHIETGRPVNSPQAHSFNS